MPNGEICKNCLVNACCSKICNDRYMEFRYYLLYWSYYKEECYRVYQNNLRKKWDKVKHEYIYRSPKVADKALEVGEYIGYKMQNSNWYEDYMLWIQSNKDNEDSDITIKRKAVSDVKEAVINYKRYLLDKGKDKLLEI